MDTGLRALDAFTCYRLAVGCYAYRCFFRIYLVAVSRTVLSYYYSAAALYILYCLPAARRLTIIVRLDRAVLRLLTPPPYTPAHMPACTAFSTRGWFTAVYISSVSAPRRVGSAAPAGFLALTPAAPLMVPAAVALRLPAGLPLRLLPPCRLAVCLPAAVACSLTTCTRSYRLLLRTTAPAWVLLRTCVRGFCVLPVGSFS